MNKDFLAAKAREETQRKGVGTLLPALWFSVAYVV
jgi:hypothetical protein